MIKDDFMKKVLIAMFIFLVLFTIGMVVIFLRTGDTPDALIVAVFGACMGEYSICGVIKNTKEREKTERIKEGFLEDEIEDECCEAHDGDSDEEAIE